MRSQVLLTDTALCRTLGLRTKNYAPHLHYALGLAHRIYRTLDAVRLIFHLRNHYIISNLMLRFPSLTFLTFVRFQGRGQNLTTDTISPTHLILYHKVIDMSSVWAMCIVTFWGFSFVTFICDNVAECYVLKF